MNTELIIKSAKEAMEEKMKESKMAILALFILNIVQACVLVYYIHKSYELAPQQAIEAMQENNSGDNVIQQGG